MKTTRWKIVFLSLLHGIFLLVLSFVWINQTRFYGDEAFLVKWTSLSKKNLFRIDPKPSPEEVLFINTSGSKMLVEKNDNILSLSPTKEVITDRYQLAELFQKIQLFKDDIKLVVLDVLLDKTSPADSILQSSIFPYKEKIIGVHTQNNDGTLDSSIIDFNTALGEYESPLSLFFKYPLMLKKEKTLPTKMYEHITNRKIDKKGVFYFDESNLAFPFPITDFKLRSSDFVIGFSLDQASYNMFNLGDVLELGNILDEEDYRQFFADRIIIIGDNESDVHNTPFGITPGMLIVYNAFLTLYYQEHLISPLWILFCILFFAFISYRIFTDLQVRIPEKWSKRIKSKIVLYALNSIDEIFFLGLLTILSYFLFNIHVNILFLFFYLKILEFILRKFNL